MARTPKKNRKLKPGISADEDALFQAAMGDVDRLDDDGDPTMPPAAPAAPKAPMEPQPRPYQPRPRTPLPHLEHGLSSDVDKRTLERLRRGRLRTEARLDLHGMTQDAAHRALTAFIPRVQASGMRCVIVVTGKGRISEGGGVLKNQVPKWLNAPDLRPLILAFSDTQPRDGGSGALYVLIRRVR
jgi:DNA-nicking Smr family endonuclease